MYFHRIYVFLGYFTRISRDDTQRKFKPKYKGCLKPGRSPLKKPFRWLFSGASGQNFRALFWLRVINIKCWGKKFRGSKRITPQRGPLRARSSPLLKSFSGGCFVVDVLERSVRVKTSVQVMMFNTWLDEPVNIIGFYIGGPAFYWQPRFYPRTSPLIWKNIKTPGEVEGVAYDGYFIA